MATKASFKLSTAEPSPRSIAKDRLHGLVPVSSIFIGIGLDLNDAARAKAGLDASRLAKDEEWFGVRVLGEKKGPWHYLPGGRRTQWATSYDLSRAAKEAEMSRKFSTSELLPPPPHAWVVRADNDNDDIVWDDDLAAQAVYDRCLEGVDDNLDENDTP